MLCDICKQREATSYFKQIVNDKVTQAHLCNECAKAHGYSDMFGTFNFDFHNLLSGFFALPGPAAYKKEDNVCCPGCGQSFMDIVQSGKVGCTQCYDTFCDKLMPSIRKIHGDTSHVGKLPHCAGSQALKKAEVERLNTQLKEAIEIQEFEKAAELRDKIRSLEGGTGNE